MNNNQTNTALCAVGVMEQQDVELSQQLAAELEAENNGPQECYHCRGTGEGSHDGARCLVCRGSGVMKSKREFDE